jgi:hypothetical protein
MGRGQEMKSQAVGMLRMGREKEEMRQAEAWSRARRRVEASAMGWHRSRCRPGGPSPSSGGEGQPFVRNEVA